MGVSKKSRLVAAVLCWFLGLFGIHRLYLGKTGSGTAMLILGLLSLATAIFAIGLPGLIVVGVWAFIDFILIIIGKMKDGQNLPVLKWVTNE